MKACDSDIASRESIGEQKYVHINIAICDYDITLEGCHRGNHRGGPTLVTAISNYDITSEGVRMDRRKVFKEGRGFYASEEGSY